MTLKRPRPSSSDLNKCQSLYFYSLAADYGFEHNALDPIKRATESAEGCVKDFIFGSKRQPGREIEKLALNSAKEYH
ncbi:uncharacterized protein Pyn_23918 [Prunus yedoensis var. nudiflora]|uniref:Uncharacterized protein n=1 Tax=Prunus yedoensis var. nudiflora TaxID=2094558 RepID=A0A314XI52_PRUYE|nr:uncharacterized protein Pyn_23918 [Prunus yedoensis var. nudiflora]